MHYLRICTVLLISFIHLDGYSDNNAIFNKSFTGVVLIRGDKGEGSGVIISANGYVLTNWHVIENNNFKIYTLGSGSFEENTREAELIKFNKKKDLALLRLKTIPKNISVIRISNIMQNVGDSVHAIGHPNGELWSYTKGYISSIRSDYSWGGTIDQPIFVGDVYQMQTPINPGNSGGPLLNNHGNLIGINTFIHPNAQNLTFAVTVKEIIRFLGN
tara:strand:+ start:3374 stop:4021 length:648 start_codon:yes stop_codon:yes gene_type:complete